MATTKQVFTGDKSQLEQAYKDLSKEVVRLEGQVQKLSNTSNNANRQGVTQSNEVSKAVRGQLASLASAALGWVSIEKAISAVNAELEDNIRLNDRRAGKQISVAQSQAQFLLNATSSSTAEKQAFLIDMQRIQRESGFPDLSKLNMAGASGASASGGDLEATRLAIEAAAPLAKHSPQDLEIIVAGALDLVKASGEKDAKKNLGFLLQVGEQSRVQGTRQTAENVAPAVSVAAKTVTSDQRQATIEAGALFAALSNEGVDPQGEVTRNAVQVISGELRSFFTEGIKVNVPGRRPMMVKPSEDPNTIEGRIRYLQENERMQKLFMANANFGRERFRVPFEQLLNRGQTNHAFQHALKNLSFDDKAYQQTVRELETATPQLVLANTAAASTGINDAIDNEAILAGRKATSRSIASKAYEQTREHSEFVFGTRTTIEEPLMRKDFDYQTEKLGRVPEEVAIEALQRRQNQIEVENIGGSFKTKPRDRWTESETKAYDKLSQEIANLNKMLAQQNKLIADQTAAAKDTAKTNRQMNQRDATRRPSVGPAAQSEIGRHNERR